MFDVIVFVSRYHWFMHRLVHMQIVYWLMWLHRANLMLRVLLLILRAQLTILCSFLWAVMSGAGANLTNTQFIMFAKVKIKRNKLFRNTVYGVQKLYVVLARVYPTQPLPFPF